MASDDAQLHSRTRLLRWTLGKRLLLGRAPLQLADSRLQQLRKRMASSWCTTLPEKLTARLGDACVAAAVRVGFFKRRRDAVMEKIDTPMTGSYADGETAASCTEERDRRTQVEAAPHDRATDAYKRAGYLLILLTWAICVWMILVYGALIYRLLGPEAEATFTRSWGIGVGLGQLKEARAVFITAAQTVLALLILEALWLAPNVAWLENAVDEASVHATLLREASMSLPSRVRTYARFNKAVV
jgi:hypothetical protein